MVSEERAPLGGLITGLIRCAHVNAAHGDLLIRRRDMRRLLTQEWLNDEIVNFYMALAMLRSGDGGPPAAIEGWAPRVHVGHSWFDDKLRSDGYNDIRKWTRPKKFKYCILDCELLFFPVNINNGHWVRESYERATRTLSRKQEEDELQKVKEDEGEEEEENDNAADLHRAHYRRHSRE